MRSVLRVLVALVGLACTSPSLAAQQSSGSDSAAVMQALDDFMRAMKMKDTTAMQRVLHPDARFTLLRPAAPPSDTVRVMVLSGAQFVKLATNPANPPIDEPTRNPRVQIDGNLATVWTEYQVRVNGSVSHCGYDAIQLVRTTSGWRLLNVADTFRRSGCGAMWPM